MDRFPQQAVRDALLTPLSPVTVEGDGLSYSWTDRTLATLHASRVVLVVVVVLHFLLCAYTGLKCDGRVIIY